MSPIVSFSSYSCPTLTSWADPEMLKGVLGRRVEGGGGGGGGVDEFGSMLVQLIMSHILKRIPIIAIMIIFYINAESMLAKGLYQTHCLKWRLTNPDSGLFPAPELQPQL